MLTFQGLSGKAAQDMEIRLEVRSPDFAYYLFGFSGGSVVKNPPANAGDVNSLPGLGRSSGEGQGDIPHLGTEPRSLTLQADTLLPKPPRKNL